MRHRIATCATVLGLLGLLPLAAPAEAAGRFSFTLHSGILLGEGAAADLSYTSTCAAGDPADLNVTVAQALAGGDVAAAHGDAPITCDGTRQTVVVHMFAGPGYNALQPGPVSVAARLTRGDQTLDHSDGITVKAGNAVVPPDVPGAPYVHLTAAELIAKGAAIDVHLAASCPAGESWHATTEIRQAQGPLGYGDPTSSPAFTCTGADQEVVIRIFSNINYPYFHRGVAVFATTATSVTPNTGIQATDWRDAKVTPA